MATEDSVVTGLSGRYARALYERAFSERALSERALARPYRRYCAPTIKKQESYCTIPAFFSGLLSGPVSALAHDLQPLSFLDEIHSVHDIGKRQHV